MWYLLCIPLVSAAYGGIGPPKLLLQPEEEVWYHLGEEEYQRRLTLKCEAENADTFTWVKNGRQLSVGAGDIDWERPGQSGSIFFHRSKPHNQGYYQCFAANIFGVAVSNKVHVRLGSLEHFPKRPVRVINVREGDSLTVDCAPPRGTPDPELIWLYRDSEDSTVIETIRSRHITTDAQGRLQFSTVELSDGRSSLLYECAATSPVLRGEYRSGDQVRLEVSPRSVSSACGKRRCGADKAATAIKKLYVSPAEITVRAGTRLKIQCIFGGRPLPTVFWSKIDGELPKGRLKDLTSAESDFGKSFIVDNVHPEDAGTYECRARHLVHTVNVRVLAAPFWEFDEPPRNVEQAEESTGELECLAGGQPTPIITWSMNGVLLHELPEDHRRVLLDHGRVLRIRQLNHDVDTGVYQCNASNPLGYVYTNAYVHVKAHEPRFLIPTQRNWKVVLHSTVYLDCSVDAAPEPIVRWVDADDRPIQIVEGKHQVVEEFLELFLFLSFDKSYNEKWYSPFTPVL
ncbi:unnamed protein product [Caenorhabditis auriculariae]|uniref:Ig-like domain-containing protein n=1 Tax=Caenorhabditis auriculariae TaxID=2777116 RepID=A0A8S1HZ03_9PELO|nr:unnamed protein product [Caenorhabditis auriculariae]